MAPDSVEQVGCIHTCQGLELDYVGVIVGPDLVQIDGRFTSNVKQRSSQDRTVRGYKIRLAANASTANHVDRIIRNTYKTLMTRGLKGCYVYIHQSS